MKRTADPFKWRHFEPEIILLCVRGSVAKNISPTTCSAFGRFRIQHLAYIEIFCNTTIPYATPFFATHTAESPRLVVISWFSLVVIYQRALGAFFNPAKFTDALDVMDIGTPFVVVLTAVVAKEALLESVAHLQGGITRGICLSGITARVTVLQSRNRRPVLWTKPLLLFVLTPLSCALPRAQDR